MLKQFFIVVFRFLFWIAAPIRIYGLENIPAAGGGLLAINHTGIIDAPLILITLRHRDDLTALVAKKHQQNLLLRLVVNSANGIWLNREETDTQAMRAVFEALAKGCIVGIAPEGTRTQSGALIKAKTGPAYIANKARVPVYPVGISGTHNGLKRLLKFQRLHITVKFGQPYTLPPIDRKNRDAGLEQATDEIMVRIAALLPPEQRGYYADHPRLHQLLSEGYGQF